MSNERELERHNNIIEQINNATTREDLPNVGFPTIASFLATNVYFNKQKISQTLFKPVIDEIVNYGSLAHPDARNAFIKVLVENYPDVTEEEIIEKYNDILNSNRINYILREITAKNLKLDQIIKEENLYIHKEMLKDINSTFEIKQLPKVGLSELNKKLLRAVNDNDFNRKIKTSEMKELTDAYLENKTFGEIEKIVEKICDTQDLSNDEKSLMKEQIIGALILDETIDYTVQEIYAKEQRKLFIYKNDHEETMDAIKEARRISQLPPNLTFSTLTSYLNGNTTIYTNDNRIDAENLKNLTQLLLDGYKWEDEVIKYELKKIASEVYPDKNDAYDLLFNKLSKLPKTYYFVEEINYSLSRQKEFIGNRCSNVNIYFIPNDKSPIDGGRFYNCYINRVDNLDLSQILPLNLDEIVPPKMDIDSIEWYIRENYDDTFKKAGGIILNKDETIGNINVFRPNDGKVGVTLEEKEKIDEISDLDKQIEEKQSKLSSIESQIESKEKQSINVEERMKRILANYEKKSLELQNEMLKSIEKLKNEIIYDNSDELADAKRKELK